MQDSRTFTFASEASRRVLVFAVPLHTVCKLSESSTFFERTIQSPTNVRNVDMDYIIDILYLFNNGRSNRSRLLNQVSEFAYRFYRFCLTSRYLDSTGDMFSCGSVAGVSLVANSVLCISFRATAQRWTSHRGR